jgi:hypothetical protein
MKINDIIISKNDTWIEAINKNKEIEFDRWIFTRGKWIIHKTLNEQEILFSLLIPYVESGKLTHIKYSHRESDDNWKKDIPVMIIYAYDNNKEEVWKILSELGIREKNYKYDSESKEDWKETTGKLWRKDNGKQKD